ncbi:MAG: PucR family transcriptional regulator ligand-binding domain-containing protein, partial [Candidatus Sericytochromatia bacterium]
MNYSLMMPENASTVETNVTSHGGISLEEALAGNVLSQATLLAGKAGMPQVVSGVIPLEVPDTIHWLKGGELVLTTGYMLRDDATSWVNWIGSLSKAKAAGLVVLASPYLKMIPDPAIEAAERAGFPLLVMANVGSMVDVVRPLQEAIEEARNVTVREGLNVQRRLMQMVLDGNGLEAVAKFLARQLNQTVFIEDKQFNLLAFSQAGPGTEPFLDELVANKGTPVATIKRWEEDSTLKALRKDRQPVAIAAAADTPARLITPIVVGGEVYGYFSLLEQRNLSDADRLIIENGCTAIAIELLKQKGVTENEQKLKRDFFRDLLLANTTAMTETLRRRATYLGYPLTSSYWIINVEFDEVKNEEGLPENINRLVSILNSLLSFRQAVVVNQAQGATILYPVKESQPTQDKVRQLSKAI